MASRSSAIIVSLLTALTCAALLSAAVLVPAPPAALPVLVLVGVGCPMLATWELSKSIGRKYVALPSCLVDSAASDAAVSELRKSLAELPETTHPLGL